jgi:hypothetical protein
MAYSVQTSCEKGGIVQFNAREAARVSRLSLHVVVVLFHVFESLR